MTVKSDIYRNKYILQCGSGIRSQTCRSRGQHTRQDRWQICIQSSQTKWIPHMNK